MICKSNYELNSEAQTLICMCLLDKIIITCKCSCATPVKIRFKENLFRLYTVLPLHRPINKHNIFKAFRLANLLDKVTIVFIK